MASPAAQYYARKRRASLEGFPRMFRTHTIYDHRWSGTYTTYNATLIVGDAVTGVTSGATGIITALDTGAPKTFQIGTLSTAVSFQAGETIRKTSTIGTPGANEITAVVFLSTNDSANLVGNIATTFFPVRSKPITFETKIQITSNGGVHRGLVFEMGATGGGMALWVGDNTIGLHAGAAGTANGATALYDRGAELPVGAIYHLIAAARPGDGRVRLWANGKELARAQASNLIFSPLESFTNGAGSFGTSKRATVVSDVPAASDQAPAGFSVIAPLSVYVNQVPRHFF